MANEICKRINLAGTYLPLAISTGLMINQPFKIQYLKALQYIVFGGIILYFGGSVLIPLAYAIFISFILYPISRWLEHHRVPKGLAILLSLGVLVLVVGGIFTLLVSQTVAFTKQWPLLESRFLELLEKLPQYLAAHFGITETQTQAWLKNALNNEGANAIKIAGNAVYFSAVSLVKLLLIPIYVAFILSIRGKLLEFLYHFFPDSAHAELRIILHEVIYTFYRFIKGMITVYLIVGTLNSIGLYFLGIPNAILFGFIASILTFIPYIGIIIGSLLPVTIAWAVHDNFLYGIGVIAVFAFVQFLEANIIFPLAVSYRLKVSTLFSVIAIFIGGLLWGVSGMILFIPALGILKMIFEKLPAYQSIAKLLEG